jgi:hypothetical protein
VVAAWGVPVLAVTAELVAAAVLALVASLRVADVARSGPLKSLNKDIYNLFLGFVMLWLATLVVVIVVDAIDDDIYFRPALEVLVLSIGVVDLVVGFPGNNTSLGRSTKEGQDGNDVGPHGKVGSRAR